MYTLTLSLFTCGLQARQLESLIRLAEARARLELAQVVTADHAKVCGPALLLQQLAAALSHKPFVIVLPQLTLLLLNTAGILHHCHVTHS